MFLISKLIAKVFISRVVYNLEIFGSCLILYDLYKVSLPLLFTKQQNFGLVKIESICRRQGKCD